MNSNENASERGHGVRLSPEAMRRALKYTLQRRAGSILFDPGLPASLQHPTCWCNRGVANAADRIEVLAQPKTKSGRLYGTTTCKNVWACPVCSGRICTTRQRDLAAGMKAHVKAGGYVYMMTLTFPHEKGAILLKPMTDAFLKARTRFKNSRAYKGILAKGIRKGSVSSLEVTFGDEHGWHPHNHDLLFATPDCFGVEKNEGEQLTEDERRVGKVRMIKCESGPNKGRLSSRLIDELKAAWFKALLKAGLCHPSDRTKVFDHGLDVRGGQFAAEYIAKFGRDEKWGMSNEATMHAVKTGVKVDGDYFGVHPFQLLTLAEGGDGRAVELFREYVEAFKSKRMLSWSPGLKKELLGVEDDSDADACDRDQPEEITVGSITSEELSILHKRRLLGNFLGFIGEYCTDLETAQEDINAYIAWARTVPVNARGEVKVRMWTRSKGSGPITDSGGRNDGFMYVDKDEVHEQ